MCGAVVPALRGFSCFVSLGATAPATYKEGCFLTRKIYNL